MPQPKFNDNIKIEKIVSTKGVDQFNSKDFYKCNPVIFCD